MKNILASGRAIVGALLAGTLLAGLSLGGCAYSPGININTHVRQEAPPAPPPPGALVQITLDLVRAQRAVPQPDPAKDLQPFLADARPYRIGASDVLAIVVWGAPDFSSPAGSVNTPGVAGGSTGSGGFVVSADGFIQVPFLGAVKAAGLTEDEMRLRLNDLLQPLFKRPHVTVSVQAYRNGRIYVDGEVRTPGQQVINDVPMTLPEAISRAGGLTAAADRSAVIVTRGLNSVRINLDALTSRGINPQSILLARGDTVRVTSNEETRVYVLGEVTGPGPKPLRKGRLSLNEALGDAGGVSPATGDPRQIYVVRATDPLKPELFHLDASTPAAMALAEGFELKPRDVVYVDPVPLVRWNRVVSLILPSAAAVTVTRQAAGIRY